jgi:streptomycin 3"-adenylyltransferase
MSQYGLSDSPAEVQAQINRLTQEFKTRLAGNLLGIYLHGSLAMNCFNPLRSDIDLLVVTRSGMSLEKKREKAESLLENSRCPSPVEISFAARRFIRVETSGAF